MPFSALSLARGQDAGADPDGPRPPQAPKGAGGDAAGMLPTSVLRPARDLSVDPEGPRHLQAPRKPWVARGDPGAKLEVRPDVPAQPEEPGDVRAALRDIEKRLWEQHTELRGYMELLRVRQEQHHSELLRRPQPEQQKEHFELLKFELRRDFKSQLQELLQEQAALGRQRPAEPPCAEPAAGGEPAAESFVPQLLSGMEDRLRQEIGEQSEQLTQQVCQLETRLRDWFESLPDRRTVDSDHLFKDQARDTPRLWKQSSSGLGLRWCEQREQQSSAHTSSAVSTPGEQFLRRASLLVKPLQEKLFMDLVPQRRPSLSERMLKRSRGVFLQETLAKALGIEDAVKQGDTSLAKEVLLICSLGVIFLNVVFLVFALNLSMDAARMQVEPPTWLYYVRVLFSCIFSLEMSLRLWLDRCRFLQGPDWFFNCMDLLLVIAGWVNIAFLIDWLDLGVLRVARVARFLRTKRVTQGWAMFRMFRLMQATLAHSLLPAVGAAALLLLVLFVFAILVLQGVEVHTKTAGGALDGGLLAYYGSVQRVMLCLFMAISGGRDWELLAEPLRRASAPHFALFIFYQVLAVFVLLNVVAALFVQVAQHVAQTDVELMQHRSHLAAQRLRDCFNKGTDPVMAQQDLLQIMRQRPVTDFLRVAGLDQMRVLSLFELMQEEESGATDRDSFVDALLRLKGPACGIDVTALVFEHRRTNLQILALMQYLESEFDHCGDQFERILRGMPAGKRREGRRVERTEDKAKKDLQDALVNSHSFNSDQAEALATPGPSESEPALVLRNSVVSAV